MIITNIHIPMTLLVTWLNCVNHVIKVITITCQFLPGNDSSSFAAFSSMAFSAAEQIWRWKMEDGSGLSGMISSSKFSLVDRATSERDNGSFWRKPSRLSPFCTPCLRVACYAKYCRLSDNLPYSEEISWFCFLWHCWTDCITSFKKMEGIERK